MKAAVVREHNAPVRIEEVDMDHPGHREVMGRTEAGRP